MATLNFVPVQNYLVRYVMTTYFALGISGSSCNCIVFYRQSRRNRTSCSVYLLAVSIISILYLVWTTFPYFAALDHVDPQTQSLAYCKMRLYGSHSLGQIVRYLVVLACVDRFFLTRTSARIRSWSSVRVALKLTIINCLVWMIVSIHIPIFMEIRGGVCTMVDVYQFFYAIYLCIVVSILPHALMIVFGYLTVRDLHQRHIANVQLRQKDHDLMRMVIVEVIVSLCTVMLYSAYFLYSSATFFVVDKSADRLAIESFINFLGNFIISAHGVAPFYIFMISSKPFRHEFTHIVVNGWYRHILGRTRVAPINDQVTAITLRHKDNVRNTLENSIEEQDQRRANKRS